MIDNKPTILPANRECQIAGLQEIYPYCLYKYHNEKFFYGLQQEQYYLFHEQEMF